MSNVCQDQETLNKALRKAVVREIRKNEPSNFIKTSSIIIYFIIIFYAVMLALKTPENTRQLHVIFAFLFSPLYIISYYLSGIKMKNNL